MNPFDNALRARFVTAATAAWALVAALAPQPWRAAADPSFVLAYEAEARARGSDRRACRRCVATLGALDAPGALGAFGAFGAFDALTQARPDRPVCDGRARRRPMRDTPRTPRRRGAGSD
jgi:hypothetical protein